MRELARPGLGRLKARLQQLGSPRAVRFLSVLLDANAEFMAYALSSSGPLGAYTELADQRAVEACFGSLLIYSANLFARRELARDDSEMLRLLAALLDFRRTAVMLKRDALRKTPRSEEWVLYTWLLKDLGAPATAFDPGLESDFGYQYVGYMRQYQEIIERRLDEGPAGRH